MVRGFALKNVLVILMVVFSFTFAYSQYVSKQVKLEKNLLALQKQKNTEHVLYSYFMAHLNKEQTNTLQIDEAKIDYSIKKEDAISRLDANICVEGCYKMILEYDHDQKCIVKNEYETLN